LLVVSLACGGGGSSTTSDPPSVALEPQAATVEAGGRVNFTVRSTGAAVGRTKTLRVEEPGGGSIAGQTYIAPGQPGVYHVRVDASGDPALSGRAEITVTAASGSSGTPANGRLSFHLRHDPITTGSVVPIGTLRINVPGPLLFTVVEPDGGAVHATQRRTGLAYAYHAPDTPGTYHIKCVAGDDPSLQCEREVHVVARESHVHPEPPDPAE
jgi:hypothetical protein